MATIGALNITSDATSPRSGCCQRRLAFERNGGAVFVDESNVVDQVTTAAIEFPTRYTPRIPLLPGTRLGPYEILSTLGAGGMGEVYRARDAKLNRDVAIKVLLPAVANDPDRLARFSREAQVLASLNHPNIAHIHGLEESGGVTALVMELVEGEDLSQRIARGPIPIDEALPIARQIAEALEAAHEQGIVHRDLKPANIKVRADGTVKVLDFGLAKAVDPAGGGPAVHLLNSPTITSPAAMTRLGVILGTAAYMAPEQAKGKPVDRGADLWAFGVVLYEMLSGKPAFEGETITDVLAAIVTRDPDWAAVPGDTPPAIRRLLRRCLERDRRKRLADAGEARYQIEDALASPSGEDVSIVRPAPGRAGVRWWLPWTALAVLALIAIALWQQSSNKSAEAFRYSIEAPSRAPLGLALRSAVAISRNGGTVVMVGTSEGVERLFVGDRNSFESRALEGTEGASHPVISPDGRWVAFLTSTKLNKVPLTGGPVVTLADVSDPRGLSWDEDDTILFVPAPVSGVFRISPGGGRPVAVTALVEKSERTHRWPQLLPGGHAVLFTAGAYSSPDNYDNATIEAVTIPGNQRKVLLSGASMARYVSSGHLVFGRGRSLFAVPFALDTMTVKGTAATVVQGLAGDSTTGVVHFAVSPGGTLAYVPAAADAAMTRPAWVDWNGRVEVLPVPLGEFADPSISPDGRRLAVSVIAGGGREIWIHDFERKTFAKLTFGGQNLTPVWSSDSNWVYYAAAEPDGAASTIYRRAADGSSEPEALVTLPNRIYLAFISPDGRTAVYDKPADAKQGYDIWRIALVKGAAPEPIVSTPFEDFGPRLSPDGRWLAYQSLESGRGEVYVRPFDHGAGRWQVSTAGGEEPKWSPDGRQLFYRSGSVMMAVPIEKSTTFQFGTPAELFSGVYGARTDTGFIYDVHPRLQKFVMIRPPQQEPTPNLVRVVDNWFSELRREVPRR
ncbi:MAG TPA: protein kinase [Vicinamibacterales bacterium]|nr:protein kinase [Vicinamibacterales bacterium]